MKKPFFLGLVLVFISSIIFAQKSVNSYKYILIPKHYEFLKSPDKYQVNSLTKFLFDKAGFTTLFIDESYPEELATNNCLALKAVVDDNSGLFTTKMKIKLLDCHNTVVYETKEGRSREKEYRKAYHEAIRKAFIELEELDYRYDESLNTKKQQVVLKEEKFQEKEKELKPAIETKEVVVVSKSKEKEINPVVAKEIKLAQEKETQPVEEKKKLISENQEELKPNANNPLNNSLEGKYLMGKWGACIVSKNENNFSVVGGDENFEFATIFKTSKPTVYIIKWAAYKQPQLLEITNNGNLKVDTENGVKIYKRTN